MGFFGKIANVARKAFGVIAPPLRKIGQFAATHHQAIATGLHGHAHSTGNETLKNISNVGLMASGVATAAGFGLDPLGMRGRGG
jgi:hypothetical protein